jgi:hypothetical protein
MITIIFYIIKDAYRHANEFTNMLDRELLSVKPKTSFTAGALKYRESSLFLLPDPQQWRSICQQR